MKPGEAAYIHSNCHDKAPTWVRLEGQHADVICSECKKVIVTLFVVGMEPR